MGFLLIKISRLAVWSGGQGYWSGYILHTFTWQLFCSFQESILMRQWKTTGHLKHIATSLQVSSVQYVITSQNMSLLFLEQMCDHLREPMTQATSHGLPLTRMEKFSLDIVLAWQGKWSQFYSYFGLFMIYFTFFKDLAHLLILTYSKNLVKILGKNFRKFVPEINAYFVLEANQAMPHKINCPPPIDERPTIYFFL